MSLSQRHVDNSKASQTEPSQANPLFVNLNANYMRQPTLCGLFTCNWYLREECNCDCVSVNVTAADTGDCNCNCDCVRERASERTNEWDSIRFGNFKMCLPNTYIMYEQTVNTALAKLSRLWSSKIFVWMRNIVQIHGHKSRQPLFFLLFMLPFRISGGHLHRRVFWIVSVYFRVQMWCMLNFWPNIMTKREKTTTASRRLAMQRMNAYAFQTPAPHFDNHFNELCNENKR